MKGISFHLFHQFRKAGGGGNDVIRIDEYA